MRLGAALFVIALAGIVGLGYGQSGLPDLIVKSVRVSPGDLEEGQAALVRAVIANIGQGDAFGFDVIFELDGQELATRSIFELKKDKSLEIQIPWKALVGTHTLTVSVDAPFSRVSGDQRIEQQALLGVCGLPDRRGALVHPRSGEALWANPQRDRGRAAL
jgi:hypothetical protein